MSFNKEGGFNNLDITTTACIFPTDDRFIDVNKFKLLSKNQTFINDKIIKGTNDKIYWKLCILTNKGILDAVNLTALFDKIELFFNQQTFSSENNEIMYDEQGNIIIDIASKPSLNEVENAPVLMLGFNNENTKGIPFINPTSMNTYVLISVYEKENIQAIIDL